MLGRLLNGHQLKDPKHRVKAQEHRPDVVMPVKPPRVPQSLEQEITPKGIERAHQHQNDLQSALTLHTVLHFGKANFYWRLSRRQRLREVSFTDSPQHLGCVSYREGFPLFAPRLN